MRIIGFRGARYKGTFLFVLDYTKSHLDKDSDLWFAHSEYKREEIVCRVRACSDPESAEDEQAGKIDAR